MKQLYRPPANVLIAEPEEIATLVIYLTSNEASFTTRATHVTDGWAN